MPRMLMFACALTLLVAPAAMAAPAPTGTKDSSGPTLTIQVKSIDQLLATFDRDRFRLNGGQAFEFCRRERQKRAQLRG